MSEQKSFPPPPEFAEKELIPQETAITVNNTAYQADVDAGVGQVRHGASGAEVDVVWVGGDHQGTFDLVRLQHVPQATSDLPLLA